MKIFFASDIHGSLYYTEKMIECFKREKADKIVLLGDVLYHGPRNPLTKEYNPAKVADILNEYKNYIIAVRGNCDSEVDQMVIEYPMMSDYNIIIMDDYKIFVTHGHIYYEENMPVLNKGDVFIQGHTHLPVIKKENGIYILNPGSITLPKENNPNSYAVLENNEFIIKKINGEIINSIIIK